MGMMASQITSLTIVYSTIIQAQIKENTKAPRHWPLGGELHWPDLFRQHISRLYDFVKIVNDCQHIYIYIYYPLYTNWPITSADLPHVIIQYILYFICQKLYWTVSGQLSNIGYIGQFQNEATGTLRTRYRRTKAVSMYLMKILSIFLHLRKILKCFRICWFL